jgi:colicin import membrane protein
LFGLGGWEIAIIALFGFMIFGPDKLPQVARTIGRVIRQFRSAQEQMNKVIKTEVYDPVKDLEPLINPFSGFSLEESKDDAKKQGATKTTGKTTDKTSDKVKSSGASEKVAVSAGVGAKSAQLGDTKTGTTKTSNAQGADTKTDNLSAGNTTPATDEKKISSDALQAAISEEAKKAREKVVKDTAKKTADASATSESFAQRRARLEREHAKVKAARADEGQVEGARKVETLDGSAEAVTSKSSSANKAPSASDERKEDEKSR